MRFFAYRSFSVSYGKSLFFVKLGSSRLFERALAGGLRTRAEKHMWMAGTPVPKRILDLGFLFGLQEEPGGFVAAKAVSD